MISRWLIPFVIAGLLLSARPAVACSCHLYTPTELAGLSEVVFTGVARSYFVSTADAMTDSADVEFQIGTVYKGPIASRIRVQALGARGWSVPNTNGCFQNVEGPITPATYGLASGQVPPRSDEALPLSIVAAFAIAALALISIARRPRRITP